MPYLLVASAAFLLAQQAVSESVARADYLATWDAQYRTYDLDGDGIVTAQEASAAQTRAQQQAALATNREIFTRIDRDADGALSPEEFALLVADVAPVDPSQFIQRFDIDRNGQITLVEHRTVMLAGFDAIDTDKDGVVTPAEMAASAQLQAQAQAQVQTQR
jgi:Ca2+-binding EF-hand superfamily protein